MTTKNYILMVKSYIRKIIRLLDIQDSYINSIRRKKTTIVHNNQSYTFSVPNKLCKFRAESFATKEPETLDWIDSFPKGSILWDIGANVGLYSIYAAKAHECIVYSFEPSVFNLEVLARNISLNDLVSLITIMPFALNNIMGKGDLNMSTENWGGALSSFDKLYGENGEDMNVIFKYPTFSISLDDAVNKLNLQFPDYIKIDVDGIELLILEGGREVLTKAKGILIELSDTWEDRKEICENLLISSGMVKVEYKTLLGLNNRKGSNNQIWARV